MLAWKLATSTASRERCSVSPPLHRGDQPAGELRRRGLGLGDEHVVAEPDQRLEGLEALGEHRVGGGVDATVDGVALGDLLVDARRGHRGVEVGEEARQRHRVTRGPSATPRARPGGR